MSDIFQCEDEGELAAYLYDECEPSARQAIEAHLAQCAACAETVASLRATRQMLSAWAPPQPALGFQITRPSVQSPASNVLRPARWWQRPLPAWAQAAAAMLIFASGLSIGLVRGAPATSQARASASIEQGQPSHVSRSELASLEQRLRGEMAQLQTAAAPAAVQAQAQPPDSDAVLRRVRALIDESEQRQRRELALRTAELVRDFDTQRRVDLTDVQQRMGQIQAVTGAEVRQHREAISRINAYLVNVSQSGR